MAGLGAGAGGFEGDQARARNALQVRGQNMQAAEGAANRRFRREEGAREDALRREQLAQRGHEFNAGLEQRNQERMAAEGRDTRDFAESRRRFDLGAERQARQDAWGDAFNEQQMADARLRHEAAQVQFDEMMAGVRQSREQQENRKRMASSGVAMLMRAAYESPDGMAPPEAVEHVKRMLGEDGRGVMGLGFDQDGNSVLVMQQFGEDGKPRMNPNGTPALENVPFKQAQVRAMLGEWFGDAVPKAHDAVARTRSAQEAQVARQESQTAKQDARLNERHLGFLGRRVDAAERQLFKAESDGLGEGEVKRAQAYYDRAVKAYDDYMGGGGDASPTPSAEASSFEQARAWAKANPNTEKARQIMAYLEKRGLQ